MKSLVLSLAALAVLVAAACGPAMPDCGPSTCSGCCDATGMCQPGSLASACGGFGGACTACRATDNCSFGSCTQAVQPCVPKTCQQAGASCGSLPDGCGGTLTCGSCAPAQSCGGGGVPNVCGDGTCTPKTCAGLGKNCGIVSDGCATTLTCGTCSGADTCGGAGVPNVCGQGCNPTTCQSQGKNCGSISDGCGATLNCGSCSGSDSCGGGGTANVCGSGCTPTTCQAQGKNCGSISDNCGATLTCGTCSGSTTCGGGGTANVCGATCAVTCPQGYTCNSQGVCAGGVATNLVLDVRTFTVSGRVTLNGATPANVGSNCTSYPNDVKASVLFTDSSRGYSVTADILCSSAAFTFSTQLYPGTYEVRVRGSSYSNIPTASYQVQTGYGVSAALSNQVFDVKTFVVSGRVTLNGAAPANVGSNCTSYPNDVKASVLFTDSSKGYSVTADILCSSAAFTFSTQLYPGTYEVRVRGSSYSNIPTASYQVQTGYGVSAALSNQVFDVKTFVVSGRVTLNGAAPANVGSNCTSYPNDVKASVLFTDSSKGYSVTADILCSSAAFTFSTQLYPGTYEVRVRGSSYSNIPTASYQVQTGYGVSAALSNQVFDVKTFVVSGRVTLNGAAPANVGSNCTSYPNDVKASVLFTDSSKGYSVTADILCSSAAFTFSTQLYPGTYEVRVRGSSYSNIPTASYQVQTGYGVSAALSNQVFDVKTFVVSGRVTLNGAAPANVGSNCTSYPNDVKASVLFTDSSKGYSVTADILCSSAAFTFSTQLYPGTYEVRVRGSSYSNVPTASYQAATGYVVSAALTNQIFNVSTVTVSGRLTLNGAAPANVGSNCTSYPNDVKASVVFTDASKGYYVTADVLCSSASFAFSTQVYPGTYEVRVRGSSYCNLPSASYQVASALEIP